MICTRYKNCLSKYECPCVTCNAQDGNDGTSWAIMNDPSTSIWLTFPAFTPSDPVVDVSTFLQTNWTYAPSTSSDNYPSNDINEDRFPVDATTGRFVENDIDKQNGTFRFVFDVRLDQNVGQSGSIVIQLTSSSGSQFGRRTGIIDSGTSGDIFTLVINVDSQSDSIYSIPNFYGMEVIRSDYDVSLKLRSVRRISYFYTNKV